MKSCLVVFYSRSGITHKVARKVALACDCDLDPIRETRSRARWSGYLRSGYEALAGTLPPILAPMRDPGDYELVLLGTPVWAGHIASPMRTYISQYKDRFHHVAAFCTMRDGGGKALSGKAFEQLAQLCGKRVIAQLLLNDKEIESDRYLNKIGSFIREIAPEMVY